MTEVEQLQVVVVAADVKKDLEALLEARKGRPYSANREWTIFEVDDEIRKLDPGAYDPQIVSIGPFHRGKRHLLPMEETKLEYLESLMSRRSSNTLHTYIDAVSDPSFLQQIAKCYSGLVIGADGWNVFVKTMVVDGCFIVEFLVRLFFDESMGKLDFYKQKISMVENDLLLIENQIPFLVLQVLFNLSFSQENITFLELTLSFIKRNTPHYDGSIPRVVHHLLHLQYSLFCPKSPSKVSKASQVWPITREFIHKTKYKISECAFWVLSVLLTCQRPRKCMRITRTAAGLPSAVELYRAGVTFQPRDTNGMLDVTFRAVQGVMEIPPLSVSRTSMSSLRNLVTIEQYYPSVGNRLTSFAVLMDNLIDTTADVEILVKNGVLESKLDGNNEVASFFTSLGKGVLKVDYQSHYLKQLYKDVKNYCEEEKHEWRASLKRTYFSNPWTAISLFAAIIVMVLTFLQTFFAIYAYFHPHP